MTRSAKKRSKGASELPDDIQALEFEAAFEALEDAVAQLETGELALEESLAFYERGVLLAERCNQILTAAELRVRQVDGDGEDAGELAL